MFNILQTLYFMPCHCTHMLATQLLNNYSDPLYSARLGRVITAFEGKPPYKKFLWEKQGYLNADACESPHRWKYLRFGGIRHFQSTVELHLSGLTGTACHPDKQKIRIIGFFLENRLHHQLKFGCYYLQYVPASKPFDHAWFEDLEATTLYCNWSDNR